MLFLAPLQQPAAIVYKRDDRERAEHGISDRQSFRETSQLWEAGRLFETGYGVLKEMDRTHPAKDFGAPPRELVWYFTFDLVDGAAYAWGWGDDRASGQKGQALQTLRRTLYIYRNGGARWELWDTLMAPEHAGISWLRPLEGGGYLLGGRFPDEAMRRQDPLAIAQNNGHGRLVIHETEAVDPGQPAFLYGKPSDILTPIDIIPGVNDQPRWFPNPKAMRLFGVLDTQTIRVPGHLVFIDLHLGRFLSVNGRTGSVEHQADLFDLPEGARNSVADYEYAILGAQPQPNGHILIASRSAEAVLQSRTWRPDLPAVAPARLSASEAFGKTAEEQGEAIETKQDEADLARAQQAKEARLRTFPDLVWWDFDPATGLFRREPPPYGVPERFPSLQTLLAFHFAFKPNGDLEIEPKIWK